MKKTKILGILTLLLICSCSCNMVDKKVERTYSKKFDKEINMMGLKYEDVVISCDMLEEALVYYGFVDDFNYDNCKNFMIGLYDKDTLNFTMKDTYLSRFIFIFNYMVLSDEIRDIYENTSLYKLSSYKDIFDWWSNSHFSSFMLERDDIEYLFNNLLDEKDFENNLNRIMINILIMERLSAIPCPTNQQLIIDEDDK